MYGYSPDGDALVFLDCFGLTRVSLPRTCKTDRKVRGGGAASVSFSADGRRALTWQDFADRVIVWELPGLKALYRFERGERAPAQLHPDGARLVTLGRDALTLTLIGLEGDARDRVPLTGGEALPPVSVPGETTDPPRALAVSPDGAFMVARGGELLAGTLGEGVRWRRRLVGAGRLRLHPGRARSTATLEQHEQTWLIDHRPTIAALAPAAAPTVAGARLAYQPDEGTVVCRDGDEITLYELPEEHAGLGVALLDPRPDGHLLFLPWHREALLDLRAGAELSRRLPEGERDVRRDISARARPLSRAARAAGARLELVDVDLVSKRAAVSLALRQRGGEGLTAALLASAARGVWASATPGGWRVSSYALDSDIDYRGLVRAGELAVALQALARAGASLAATFGFWSALYERRLRGRAPGEPARPCDPGAEGLLARALLAALAGHELAALDPAALALAGPPTVDEALAGLEDYARRSAALGYETTRVVCFVFNHLLGPAAARLWISAFFEQRWDFCGTLYYDLEEHGVLALARAHPTARAAFETWLSEHPLPEDDKRFYVARVRDALAALPRPNAPG